MVVANKATLNTKAADIEKKTSTIISLITTPELNKLII